LNMPKHTASIDYTEIDSIVRSLTSLGTTCIGKRVLCF